MACSSPDLPSRTPGVPRSWDRRYGRWARQAVERRSTDRTPPPDSDGDGIYQAALVGVLAAALSGAIFFVLAWLFDIGPVAGVFGSIVCSTLCWWWMDRAVGSAGGG